MPAPLASGICRGHPACLFFLLRVNVRLNFDVDDVITLKATISRLQHTGLDPLAVLQHKPVTVRTRLTTRRVQHHPKVLGDIGGVWGSDRGWPFEAANVAVRALVICADMVC